MNFPFFYYPLRELVTKLTYSIGDQYGEVNALPVCQLNEDDERPYYPSNDKAPANRKA